MNSFTERHQDKIAGTLSCFDRVIINDTLPDIGYSGAMARYLSPKNLLYFDYTTWANPLRNQLRHHAEALACTASARNRLQHCATYGHKKESHLAPSQTQDSNRGFGEFEPLVSQCQAEVE